MADQLYKQKQLQRTIERALDNFRKLGRANQTPAKIRCRISLIQEAWNQFNTGHCKLFEVIPVADQSTLEYFKDKYYNSTEETYITTMDHFSEALEGADPSGSPKVLSTPVRERQNPELSLAQLPSINLLTFDGQYDKWEHFRDRFTSLIISNKELSDFARMHYLSSSLTGSALECISSLAITAESFNIAWETLKSRFQNKRRLLYKHFDSLFDLSSLTRESVSDLQLLCDRTSAITAALRNLNRTTEQLWNDVLVYLISKKLDPVTRKSWRLRSSDNDELPSFDELFKFLVTRTQALEDESPSSPSIVRFSSRSSQIRRVAIASAVSKPIMKCKLCDGKHYINSCPQFLNLSPSQRRDLVQKSKRCFNCLSQSHSVQDCRSKYTCRVCQKRHHSFLHVASETNSSALASPSSSALDNNRREILLLCSTAHPHINSRVLLATAKVSVRASSGRVSVVRALLDQGSEMSFITENLAQLLRVHRIRMPVEVSAVGGVSAGIHQYATQINISPRDASTPTFSTTAYYEKID